jgi:serine protease
MASRAELLAGVRAKQQVGSTPAKPLRIILEFEKPRAPDAVAAAINERLQIRVEAARLSEAHGLQGAHDGLAQFMAVTIIGVEAADVADSPFELGYALADATDAVTAEPELGTDFYIVPRTGEQQLEGIDNFPPGCWVDPKDDPTGEQPHWAVKKIKAEDAWSLAPKPGGKAKGEGVLIFQPDTGVADHVELEPGTVDLNLAYDFINNKQGAADPMDYSGNPGHGTGTSSVVASRESGKIAGAAPLATLVPLRAVTSVIVFDHGRVAVAVEYARRKGARVITMSLGAAFSSALHAAIRGAIHDGIIVMAAAGNCVGFVVWPARYDEVIAVAGYNINDRPWIGSCHGDAVDITAPGEFVPRANRAPQNGGSPIDVHGGQGTSFAVALTAGVAALWIGHFGITAIRKSLQSGETVQDRFVALLQETSWQPPGFDTSEFGAGIIDAVKLLKHGLQPQAAEPEMVFAVADPLRSVRTMLAELAPGSMEAVADASAGPPNSRRYAAELSHLALLKRKKMTSGIALERVEVDTPPSETLQREFAQTGRTDLLAALS